MKTFRFSLVLLLWAAMLIVPATDALAVLKDLGPVNAASGVANGYPVWYRDFSSNVSANGQDFPQGLPLVLCDSQTQNINGYLCNLLPEDPAAGAPGFIPELPRDFATNFPHESFYFMADAALTGTDFSDAGLTIGLEAAFGADVAPGNQITFARVRVRVDITTPGNYRITHPYGVLNFPNVSAGTRTINYTDDVGIGNPGEFSGALAGAIGPFLTWDNDFPIIVGDDVFIGDPAVPHTVTGSPFDTNVFRIERVDALGNVLSTAETDLFTIVGKIYTTPIASPLKATRASYVRNADGAQIFVFAQADVVSNDPPSLSSLQVSAADITPTLMSTDGNGNFFARLATSGDNLPAAVSITNLADIPNTTIEVPVSDEVSISSAVYNADNQILTLKATSSDSTVPPILTTQYGNLINGLQVVTELAAPPADVTVTSSANGHDTEQLQITFTDLNGGEMVMPNGGEVLFEGSQVLVTWANFSGDAVRYRLFYFDADGTPHFVANVHNATSYSWTVPEVITEETGKLFRVTAFDAANNVVGIDFSDASFSIVPNPAIFRVIAPNGSELLTSGDIFNVEWSPRVGAVKYRLFYFDADGAAHPVASVGNLTSYAWTVPAVLTEEAGKTFRVSAFDEANNNLGVDFSNASFTIQPAPLP